MIPDVRLALELARQADVPETERQAAFQCLINQLPALTPFWSVYQKPTFPTHLFRATSTRSVLPQEEHIPRRFSYPEPEQCGLGRANLPSHPVLYLSENQETAIQEARCRPGETIFLSEWALDNPIGTRLGILLHESLDQGNAWIDLQDQPKAEIGIHLNASHSLCPQQLHELCILYCKAFRSDNYCASSLIAHQLLYGPAGAGILDMLIYPSQAGEQHFCNMAVAPSFADRNLRMIRVLKLRAGNNGGKDTQLMAAGEIMGGMIEWKRTAVN
jgi:hypothetical protein